MECSPSSEANILSDDQEIPRLLWYSVHKSPPLVLILNQMKPVHTISTL